MQQLIDAIKRHSTKIVLGLFLFFFGISLLVSRDDAATYDERAHIPSAYSYIRYSDMRINPEHPPLLKDLAGFPLLFLDVKFPINDKLWTEGTNEQWDLGTLFISKFGNNADDILFFSRLPIILLSLLLGYFIFRWTKELGGTLAGVIAVALYTLDPNIIAHNHYVTTDLGIAAAIFIATYYFIRFLKEPSLKNILYAGIALSIAQLTKFSAVLLFPIFGIILFVYAIAKYEDETPTLKEKFFFVLTWIKRYCQIILIAFIGIYVVYAANTWNMPAQKSVDVAYMMFHGDRAEKVFARETIRDMAEIPVLKPLTHYTLGVFMVVMRVGGGNNFYFNNPFFHDTSRELVSSDASPWYFPAVFLMKETIPFLFLLCATTLYTLYRIGKAFTQKTTSREQWHFIVESLRSRIAQWTMAFFVLFYAFLSITGNLNIGFRHLFPIMPFLYLLIAKTLSDFTSRQIQKEEVSNTKGQNGRKNIFAILGLGCFAWMLSIVLITYPSYLSYFNETIGIQNGYLYVTDSNYDWGQDLKRVKTFVDTYNEQCAGKLNSSPLHFCATFPVNVERIDTIRIDYFGGSDPQSMFGDAYIPWYGSRAPEAGWYALSSFFVQENLYKTKAGEEPNYSWLIEKAPVMRAGQSIFIYHFSEEEIWAIKNKQ